MIFGDKKLLHFETANVVSFKFVVFCCFLKQLFKTSRFQYNPNDVKLCFKTWKALTEAAVRRLK